LILRKTGVSVSRRYHVGIASVSVCWSRAGEAREGTARWVLRRDNDAGEAAGVPPAGRGPAVSRRDSRRCDECSRALAWGTTAQCAGGGLEDALVVGDDGFNTTIDLAAGTARYQGGAIVYT
jgi:hypothetical protein